MNKTLSGWWLKVRQGGISVPMALVAAAGMVTITEVAYRAQTDALAVLQLEGQARWRMVNAMQRLTEAESGKRGYLLVQDKIYLKPYLRAAEDVMRELDLIDQLDRSSSDPEIAELQGRVRQQMLDKISEMREVMRLHDSGRRDQALEMVRTGIGHEMMLKLRDQVQAVLIHRNQHIKSGLEGVQRIFLLGRIGVLSLTVLSTIILIALITVSRRFDRERELQRESLKAERDHLEREVASGLDDLRELTLHLQTAREDERARLARELHDELGALLTSAKLHVAYMRPKLRQMPDVEPKLQQLVESLNAGIALKRRIIEDLSPSSLRSLGLVPALEILCGEMSQASGVDIIHQLQGASLCSEKSLAVYRFVQEALTNMAKYAHASRAMVRMRAQQGEVWVEVWDNGQGFDADKAHVGSHGLRGMRFRMEAMGGRMTVQSSRQEGSRLSAWLPEDAEAQGRPDLTAA
jgi:signal transduction histidine kinase